jgi:hypothetical protein
LREGERGREREREGERGREREREGERGGERERESREREITHQYQGTCLG